MGSAALDTRSKKKNVKKSEGEVRNLSINYSSDSCSEKALFPKDMRVGETPLSDNQNSPIIIGFIIINGAIIVYNSTSP